MADFDRHAHKLGTRVQFAVCVVVSPCSNYFMKQVCHVRIWEDWEAKECHTTGGQSAKRVKSPGMP